MIDRSRRVTAGRSLAGPLRQTAGLRRVESDKAIGDAHKGYGVPVIPRTLGRLDRLTARLV